MMLRYIPLLLLFSVPASAQDFYFRATAGYAASAPFGDPLQLDGYPFSGIYSPDPGQYIQYKEKSSLATGSRATLTAGWQLREHFGLELSFDQSLQNRVYESSALLPGPDNPRTTVKLQAKNTQLLGVSAAWTPKDIHNGVYMRLGVAVPLSRRIGSISQTRSDSAVFTDVRNYETKFGIAVRAGIGYNLPLSRNLSVCAEASFVGMALQMKRAELTASSKNGEDILSTKTERERVVDYRRDYIESRTLDPNRPGQMPEYRMPFSNVGLSVGVLVTLG